MLSDDMKDVYQNIYMETQINKENFPDLASFLEDANANKKITYDLPKFITLLVLTYNKHKTAKFSLEQNFQETFQALSYLYNLKPAFEIDQWRQIRGITLDRLKEDTGLTKKALFDIRMGDSRPKYDTLIKICNALDITFYQLKLPPLREKK